MKTIAVIVTYADRFNFVKQVVNRLLSFNILRIVIVNNNSVSESIEGLKSLSASNPRVMLINLDRNTGSAYAFNRGMEYAMNDAGCEYIWLLDDDNLPEFSALEVLHDVYQKSIISRQHLLLASFRTVKKNYIKAVKNSTPEITLGWNNGFRSFHIYHSFMKQHVTHFDPDREYGEVYSVPYGGMFFHKELVAARGKFDESYYLYLDDTDFCLRHRAAGGVVICVIASRIDDLEISCYNTGRTIINFAAKKIYFQMYYYIRNRVYFEKKYLITSWLVYLLNMSIYSFLFTLLALSRLRFKNIRTYYSALYDGLTGHMGYNKKYRI